MKQCPTCQKEYADGMKFCQTDGTPLVAKEENIDPFKTVVGMPPIASSTPSEPQDSFKNAGQKKANDDLLQLPDEKADPNKTMVSLPDSVRASIPKSEPPPAPSFNAPPAPENKPFNPPPVKPSDAGLNAPSFGDLSGSKPMDAPKPPESSSPFNPPPLPKNDPPPSPFGSPFSNQGGQSDSPFGKSPSSSPFDSPQSSPFEKTPPPPYKEPESFSNQKPPAFNQSPFSQPETPFAEKSNDPFGQPSQQNDWTPPPAPVASWQDQGIGADTPFQPPVAGTGGQNNTLAIVSLVCGILSICLCGFLTGVPAIITGFMAKNNADSNPAMYGGRGMAIAGMITGVIGTLFTVLYVIFVFLGNMRF